MRKWIGATLLGLTCACAPDGIFGCSEHAHCNAADGSGRCEPTGYCSFADPTCATGRRYGEHAPQPYAGACVEMSEGSTSESPTLERGATSTTGPT